MLIALLRAGAYPLTVGTHVSLISRAIKIAAAHAEAQGASLSIGTRTRVVVDRRASPQTQCTENGLAIAQGTTGSGVNDGAIGNTTTGPTDTDTTLSLAPTVPAVGPHRDPATP
jgi:hypothetical protein